MKTRILITALTAGLLGMTTAYAHGDRDPGQMFSALDANDDGQLSASELKSMHDIMVKQRFKQADTNSDGQIDKDEFMAKAQDRAEHMFKHMDRNDDGVLDTDEAKPRHHGDRMAQKNEGKGKRHFDPMKKMDSNDDGMISRNEWDSAMAKFHAQHKDHDTE